MSNPKSLPHSPGYKYRLCKKCGEKWNISRKDPGGRFYICWKCEKKIKFIKEN